MGIRYITRQEPDLYDYEPEYNKDGSEKHIVCDGARFHVVSYSFSEKHGTQRYCSEPNCEINRRREATIKESER